MLKLPSFLRNALGTHGEPAPKPLAAPIFVTGCMRSGTTFLVDKMATHPQLLKIGVEMNAIWDSIGGAPIKGTCAHRTAEDASPEYTFQMARYIADFISESQSFKRKAMRRYAKYYHGLGRASYDWDHIIPVNKSPHLMNKIGYVSGLFPQSTLVLIVRDIYSHSASMKVHFQKLQKADGRQYFLSPDPTSCYGQTYDEVPSDARAFPAHFDIIPEMWMRMNALAIEEFAAAKCARKVVIRYEDLVTKQGEVLRALFEALDLLPEHRSEGEQIAQKATALVNTTTKGDPLVKWKTQLSEEEKSAVERVVTTHGDAYAAIQEFVANNAI